MTNSTVANCSSARVKVSTQYGCVHIINIMYNIPIFYDVPICIYGYLTTYDTSYDTNVVQCSVS